MTSTTSYAFTSLPHSSFPQVQENLTDVSYPQCPIGYFASSPSPVLSIHPPCTTSNVNKEKAVGLSLHNQLPSFPHTPGTQEKLRSILFFKPNDKAESYWIRQRPYSTGVHHEWRSRRLRFVHVPDPDDPAKSFVSIILADDQQNGNESENHLWSRSFDVDLVILLDQNPPLTECNASLIRYYTTQQTVQHCLSEIHPLVSTFLDPGIDAAIVEVLGLHDANEPTVSFFTSGVVESTLNSILERTSCTTTSISPIRPAKGSLTFKSSSYKETPTGYCTTNKQHSTPQEEPLPFNQTAFDITSPLLPLRCLFANCLFVSLDRSTPIIFDAVDFTPLTLSQSTNLDLTEIENTTFVHLRCSEHIAQFLCSVRETRKRLPEHICFATFLSLFSDTCRHPFSVPASQLCRFSFLEINVKYTDTTPTTDAMGCISNLFQDAQFMHRRPTGDTEALSCILQDILSGTTRTLLFTSLPSTPCPKILTVASHGSTVFYTPQPSPSVPTGTIARYLTKWDKAVIRVFVDRHVRNVEDILARTARKITGNTLCFEALWGVVARCSTPQEAILQCRELLCKRQMDRLHVRDAKDKHIRPLSSAHTQERGIMRSPVCLLATTQKMQNWDAIQVSEPHGSKDDAIKFNDNVKCLHGNNSTKSVEEIAVSKLVNRNSVAVDPCTQHMLYDSGTSSTKEDCFTTARLYPVKSNAESGVFDRVYERIMARTTAETSDGSSHDMDGGVKTNCFSNTSSALPVVSFNKNQQTPFCEQLLSCGRQKSVNQQVVTTWTPSPDESYGLCNKHHADVLSSAVADSRCVDTKSQFTIPEINSTTTSSPLTILSRPGTASTAATASSPLTMSNHVTSFSPTQISTPAAKFCSSTCISPDNLSASPPAHNFLRTAAFTSISVANPIALSSSFEGSTSTAASSCTESGSPMLLSNPMAISTPPKASNFTTAVSPRLPSIPATDCSITADFMTHASSTAVAQPTTASTFPAASTSMAALSSALPNNSWAVPTLTASPGGVTSYPSATTSIDFTTSGDITDFVSTPLFQSATTSTFAAASYLDTPSSTQTVPTSMASGIPPAQSSLATACTPAAHSCTSTVSSPTELVSDNSISRARRKQLRDPVRPVDTLSGSFLVRTTAPWALTEHIVRRETTSTGAVVGPLRLPCINTLTDPLPRPSIDRLSNRKLA